MLTLANAASPEICGLRFIRTVTGQAAPITATLQQYDYIAVPAATTWPPEAPVSVLTPYFSRPDFRDIYRPSRGRVREPCRGMSYYAAAERSPGKEVLPSPLGGIRRISPGRDEMPSAASWRRSAASPARQIAQLAPACTKSRPEGSRDGLLHRGSQDLRFCGATGPADAAAAAYRRVLRRSSWQRCHCRLAAAVPGGPPSLR